jgi:hypothetical protein
MDFFLGGKGKSDISREDEYPCGRRSEKYLYLERF